MGRPTVTDVGRIAALADPVVRNLQITQCYHELSQALAGAGGRGANWCTFATWASKQAGQTIRGDDLARTAEDRLGQSAEVDLLLAGVQHALALLGKRRDVRALRETLFAVLDPQAALRRAGAAVARGNLKVFEEIGREFARFLALFDDGTPVDAERVRRDFCAGLRPGEPPGGQRLLCDAFAAYGEAFALADPKARAEHMFFANLLVGLHEQTRLQPEIAAAVDVSLGDPEAVRQRLLRALLPGRWLRVRLQFARLLGAPPPLDVALDRLIEHVRARLRQAVTEALLTLHLPGRILRLGRDLDMPYPATLAQLTHPELTGLLAQIDPTPDSLAGSGTADWTDLPDRMHFITDLFRCYHDRPELFDAPFTPAQVARLRAGRRPDGRL